MSFEGSTELSRLERFRIECPLEGDEYCTLFFGTENHEWVCVADSRILHQLASSIQKNVPDPKNDNS